MDFSSRLLLTPLFQGFSRLDFLDIVGRTAFDFRTYRAREVVCRQGDECRSICMLLGGEVDCEAESPEHNYTLCERVKAPFTFPFETLYGLHNRQQRTVRAASEAQAVLLDKRGVTGLLLRYPVFQMNFHNLLSTQAQLYSSYLWRRRGAELEECFRSFLLRRCLRPVGEKTLRVRMETLAGELGTTRLRVSGMLASLASRGVLDYGRGRIHIPALELL